MAKRGADTQLTKGLEYEVEYENNGYGQVASQKATASQMASRRMARARTTGSRTPSRRGTPVNPSSTVFQQPAPPSVGNPNASVVNGTQQQPQQPQQNGFGFGAQQNGGFSFGQTTNNQTPVFPGFGSGNNSGFSLQANPPSAPNFNFNPGQSNGLSNPFAVPGTSQAVTSSQTPSVFNPVTSNQTPIFNMPSQPQSVPPPPVDTKAQRKKLLDSPPQFASHAPFKWGEPDKRQDTQPPASNPFSTISNQSELTASNGSVSSGFGLQAQANKLAPIFNAPSQPQSVPPPEDAKAQEKKLLDSPPQFASHAPFKWGEPDKRQDTQPPASDPFSTTSNQSELTASNGSVSSGFNLHAQSDQLAPPNIFNLPQAASKQPTCAQSTYNIFQVPAQQGSNRLFQNLGQTSQPQTTQPIHSTPNVFPVPGQQGSSRLFQNLGQTSQPQTLQPTHSIIDKYSNLSSSQTSQNGPSIFSQIPSSQPFANDFFSPKQTQQPANNAAHSNDDMLTSPDNSPQKPAQNQSNVFALFKPAERLSSSEAGTSGGGRTLFDRITVPEGHHSLGDLTNKQKSEVALSRGLDDSSAVPQSTGTSNNPFTKSHAAINESRASQSSIYSQLQSTSELAKPGRESSNASFQNRGAAADSPYSLEDTATSSAVQGNQMAEPGHQSSAISSFTDQYFNDAQKLQLSTGYRLKKLDMGLKKHILRAKSFFAEADDALRFYLERKAAILEGAGTKRSAPEEDILETLQSKRSKTSSSGPLVSLSPKKPNMSGPSSGERAVLSGFGRPTSGNQQPPIGKRKADEQLTKDNGDGAVVGGQKKPRNNDPVSYPTLPSDSPSSQTASIFKNILQKTANDSDGSNAYTERSSAPVEDHPSLFLPPFDKPNKYNTNSDRAVSSSSKQPISPSKGSHSFLTRSTETPFAETDSGSPLKKQASIFTQPSSTSDMGSIDKPIAKSPEKQDLASPSKQSPVISSSAIPSHAPAIFPKQARMESGAATTAKLTSFKPPTFATATTNFMAQLGKQAEASSQKQPSGESNSTMTAKPTAFKPPTFADNTRSFIAQFGKQAEATELENKRKRMEEDVDSDEDAEEWEQNYDERQRAKKQKFEEIAKSAPKFGTDGRTLTSAQEKGKDAIKSVDAADSHGELVTAAGANIRPDFSRLKDGNSVFSSSFGTPSAGSQSKDSVSENIFGHLAGIDADYEESESSDEDEDKGGNTTTDGANDRADSGLPRSRRTTTPPAKIMGEGLLTTTPKANPFSQTPTSTQLDGKPASDVGPGGDQTYKQGSPIVFGGSSKTPSLSITSPSPSKSPSALGGLFGASKGSVSDIPAKPSPILGASSAGFSFGGPPKSAAGSKSATSTESKCAASFNLNGIPNAVSDTNSQSSSESKSLETPVKPLSSIFSTTPTNPPSAFSFLSSVKPATDFLSARSVPASNNTSRATSPGATTGGESANEASADAANDSDLTAGEIYSRDERAGEQDEDVLFELTKARSLKWNGELRRWDTKGVGPLRVLKHRETKKTRILMRNGTNGSIVLNSALISRVEYQHLHHKHVKLPVAEEPGKLATYLIKTGKDEDSRKLMETLQEHKTT